ncbi:unnamed protein product [Brugia timori]|uniref:Uncharacterized protein n=1 Tax=Brugia timori TaxID=42155 RepID=A0A0R3QJB7_9BILA|nr:unnamed protein product [Brugia timori]
MNLLIYLTFIFLFQNHLQITDESLDRHDSSVFGKRAKFAFAKRHPSRFAFAKRYDDEDVNYYDKKAMHFESPIHPTRNFAFAKRGPYLSFA